MVAQNCILVRPSKWWYREIRSQTWGCILRRLFQSLSANVLDHLKTGILSLFELWSCYKKFPKVMERGKKVIFSRILQPWGMRIGCGQLTVAMMRQLKGTKNSLSLIGISKHWTQYLGSPGVLSTHSLCIWIASASVTDFYEQVWNNNKEIHSLHLNSSQKKSKSSKKKCCLFIVGNRFLNHTEL